MLLTLTSHGLCAADCRSRSGLHSNTECAHASQLTRLPDNLSACTWGQGPALPTCSPLAEYRPARLWRVLPVCFRVLQCAAHTSGSLLLYALLLSTAAAFHKCVLFCPPATPVAVSTSLTATLPVLILPARAKHLDMLCQSSTSTAMFAPVQAVYVVLYSARRPLLMGCL